MREDEPRATNHHNHNYCGRRVGLALLTCLTLLTAGCPKEGTNTGPSPQATDGPQPKPKEERIVGRVVDLFDQPVSEAEVGIRGTKLQATTGADGRFSLDYFPGEITVEVTKGGFAPRTQTLKVAQKVYLELADTVLAQIPAKGGIFTLDGSKRRLVPLTTQPLINRKVYTRDVGRALPLRFRGPVATFRLPGPGKEARFLDSLEGDQALVRVAPGNTLAKVTIGFGSRKAVPIAGVKEQTQRLSGLVIRRFAPRIFTRYAFLDFKRMRCFPFQFLPDITEQSLQSWLETLPEAEALRSSASAGATLAKEFGAQAIPIMQQGLTSTNAATRAVAAACLGALGPRAKAAVPALELVLNRADDPARSLAAEALIEIVGAKAPESALRLVVARGARGLTAAIHALGSVPAGNPRRELAIELLTSALSAKPSAQRTLAFDYLQKVGGAAVPRLLSLLEPKRAIEAQRVALLCVLKIEPESPRVVEVLERIVQRKDSALRELAGLGLIRAGRGEPVHLTPIVVSACRAKRGSYLLAALLQDLESTSSQTRERAVAAFGLAGPAGVSSLSSLVEGKQTSAVAFQAAATALSRIKPPPVRALLSAATHWGYRKQPERQQALISAAAATCPAGLPLLLKELVVRSRGRYPRAAKAVFALLGRSALPFLQREVSRAKPSYQLLRASIAIGEPGFPVILTLQRQLRDQITKAPRSSYRIINLVKAVVREVTATKSTSQAALDCLLEATLYPDYMVRNSALETISTFGERARPGISVLLKLLRHTGSTGRHLRKALIGIGPDVTDPLTKALQACLATFKPGGFMRASPSEAAISTAGHVLKSLDYSSAPPTPSLELTRDVLQGAVDHPKLRAKFKDPIKQALATVQAALEKRSE